MASDMETVNIGEGIQSGEYDKEGDFQPSTSMETCEGEFGDGGGEGISSEMLDYLVSTEDSYNFELCVSVTETETDEVNAEFSVAIEEIDGEKSFPCSQCEKICKSKGGLTRHTNSKHCDSELGEDGQAVVEGVALCEETVSSFVETIKASIKEQNLYGKAINTGLAAASSTPVLFTSLLPLYKAFCRKKNQDVLLESFYGLIPRSCELLCCKDFRVANLIMIHLPEHLIGFYNISQTGEDLTANADHSSQLDPAEQGPLSYLTGYVVAKLIQLNRKKTKQGNEELQALLMSIKSPELLTNNYISARTRGGLITPCDDLVKILEIAEIAFREQVDKCNLTLRNIPIEIICNTTLSSPTVKSLWDNIVIACEPQPSSSTQKLCLENIVKLYLKVRGFSYARDYITKYRIKAKQVKKKALRKELKKSDAVNI